MLNRSGFFLNARSGLVPLDCIEFSHPEFAAAFRYIRNDSNGITVRHEDGIKYHYEYRQMRIGGTNVRTDLDQKFSIELIDEDDTFKKAYKALVSTDPVRFAYRIYRDDDLEGPMWSVTGLLVDDVRYNTGGKVVIDIVAAQLNSVSTGRDFNLTDYPLLRGYT